MDEQKPFPKKWIVIGVVVLIIVILLAIILLSYNNLVRLSQGTDNAWANVETQYQRRIDLIPNLVNVVESYAKFEKELLTNITAIRSQWQTAQTPEQKVQTANQFESTISKLLLVSENYPDLKASQQFISLQDNLAETENMVAVARTRYNAAVQDYNSAVKVFPSNMIAGMFGFQPRTYFKAAAGAENAPKVNISIA